MTNTQHTDGMGFTEYQWERMWNSETATSTAYHSSDDEEAGWQRVYDAAIAAGATEAEAIDAADSEA